jgi:hypothetical protein
MIDVGGAFNFPLVETRGYKMIDAVYSPTKKDTGNGQGFKPASNCNSLIINNLPKISKPAESLTPLFNSR